MPELAMLLPSVIDIAISAGGAILPFYQSLSKMDVVKKPDNSPVTAADQAADALIVEQLGKLPVVYPCVSEEQRIPSFKEREKWQRYWLVDPLDGTRGFIQGSDEFTVNIALIDKGRSVLGVIYQPVTGECYFASQGEGAFYQRKGEHAVRLHAPHTTRQEEWRILCGRSDRASAKMAHLCQSAQSIRFIPINSSIKFCRLAHNLGDFYVRFGPTSEWDTAAGQCILTEANGLLVDFHGNPLQYNAKSSLLNPPFVAVRDASKVPWVLEQIKIIRRNS